MAKHLATGIPDNARLPSGDDPGDLEVHPLDNTDFRNGHPS
jgi:hypothetical protein